MTIEVLLELAKKHGVMALEMNAEFLKRSRQCDAYERCCKFLAGLHPQGLTKRSERIGAYRLKHIVEDPLNMILKRQPNHEGYVYEKVLVVAALECGFHYDPETRSLDISYDDICEKYFKLYGKPEFAMTKKEKRAADKARLKDEFIKNLKERFGDQGWYQQYKKLGFVKRYGPVVVS